MEIVQLDPTTAPLLQNLAPDVFDHPIQPQSLQAFLNDPRHVMVLALDADLVVGMASGVEYFHPDKPPQLWINEVGVASTHRCRGIGRALTAALVAEARSRGCTYAWLGTEQDNQAAQACFSAVAAVEPAQAFFLYEWELDT